LDYQDINRPPLADVYGMGRRVGKRARRENVERQQAGQHDTEKPFCHFLTPKP